MARSPVYLTVLVTPKIRVSRPFMFAQILPVCEIAQRVVRPFFVVFWLPVFCSFADFAQCLEHIHVQNPTPIRPVESLPI